MALVYNLVHSCHLGNNIRLQIFPRQTKSTDTVGRALPALSLLLDMTRRGIRQSGFWCSLFQCSDYYYVLCTSVENGIVERSILFWATGGIMISNMVVALRARVHSRLSGTYKSSAEKYRVLIGLLLINYVTALRRSRSLRLTLNWSVSRLTRRKYIQMRSKA